MLIGDPRRMDSRGLLYLDDSSAVVLPGYRLPELPDYLAAHMIEVLDTYSREPGTITFRLDTGTLAFEEPAQRVCGQTERLTARIVKCGIPDGYGGGIWWRVLAESNTGIALVAGSQFFTISH